MTQLVEQPATVLARLLKTRKVSASEVMRAHIARIEQRNPKLNAIVTFVPEQALAAAKAMDRKREKPGPLYGLPIAYKDLVPTRGVRTTYGSLVFENEIPGQNHAVVDRLAAAGAILVGKTNTPEFGAGSQTFNSVFGATRNPYDPAKTCGGSSGGAAAAVAARMLPFADGSDLAASLRNPGNYCNVVGFRPTPGRVPSWPAADAWDTLSVMGAIGRTVADAALLFSAMAGSDPRAPVSFPQTGEIFRKSLARNFGKTRIAWSRDLGGLPMDPRVTQVLAPMRKTLQELGCVVEDAEPDFDGATESFETLRAIGFLQKYGALADKHGDKLKDTVRWNVEEGRRRSGADVARAQALRTELFQRMRAFLERYEFLVCPVNQLPPYPVEVEWPREIAGVPMGNYLDWMKSCYYITITSHPAISVPAGFTAEGLPVGLQIVGRYRDDLGVLQLAHAFESLTGAWKQTPP
ncbi:MAG TPA: amidase [Burkholderiales bacterium]|nr:amidase [Burkholderiales bacterium]